MSLSLQWDQIMGHAMTWTTLWWFLGFLWRYMCSLLCLLCNQNIYRCIGSCRVSKTSEARLWHSSSLLCENSMTFFVPSHSDEAHRFSNGNLWDMATTLISSMVESLASCRKPSTSATVTHTVTLHVVWLLGHLQFTKMHSVLFWILLMRSVCLSPSLPPLFPSSDEYACSYRKPDGTLWSQPCLGALLWGVCCNVYASNCGASVYINWGCDSAKWDDRSCVPARMVWWGEEAWGDMSLDRGCDD